MKLIEFCFLAGQKIELINKNVEESNLSQDEHEISNCRDVIFDYPRFNKYVGLDNIKCVSFYVSHYSSTGLLLSLLIDAT